MKILLSLSIASLTFLSSYSLLAEDSNNQIENNRLEEAGKLGCESAPISHLPSSISYLGVTPKLMMNPSLEEGTKSLAEALGILEKRAVIGERPVAEVASISSNSSSQVLRLRGGGPKKSQPMGGLKSTGDTSDEDDYAADASFSEEEGVQDMLNAEIDESIETTRRAHVANNVLEKRELAKKEFKNNRALASGRTDDDTRSVGTVDSEWIQETLYKTAQIKLGATLKKEQIDLRNNGSHSPSSESQGLAAKEKMASLRLKQAELALTKAQRVEETAKARLITEEGTYKEILADSFATPLDQENSSLNMIYQRALVTYTTSDHELKKLMRDLAEAKLATVNAELMIQEAQHIEGDLSFLNEAETGLEVAKEAEEAAEAVTDPVANETAARNTWCEALKRAFETTIETNALRKKIQSSASLSSPSSRSTTSNDILQETQATEQAWGEVMEICNSALDKKLDLRLKIAWEKDLEEAANQHSLWQIRVLWLKARKTAENSKSSNISQDAALQQAKEISSVYEEMVETMRKKQNETPARLKSWWNHDLQQIETQRTAHQEYLTKLKEAEARRKAEAEKARIAAEKALEQERAAKREADRLAQEKAAAKAKADAQAAKELSDALEIARVAWNNAVELSSQTEGGFHLEAEPINNKSIKTNLGFERIDLLSNPLSDTDEILLNQTDTAKKSADNAKTENSYKELNRFAQSAATAWAKAEEMKKIALSKTTDMNEKASLNAEIQTAISNKEEYDKIAKEALANAQEVVKEIVRKAAEMKVKAEAEKRAAEEQAKAIREMEAAAQLARERAKWLEIQKKVKPEVERKMGEVRERMVLMERRVEEVTETNRLAWEKIEKLNKQWMVISSTKKTAKEKAERALANLESVKEEAREERRISEADFERWQEVLTRLEKSPKENEVEVMKKMKEAQSKVTSRNTTYPYDLWYDVAINLEAASEYWTKAHRVQQANNENLIVNYSEIAITLERAAQQYKLAAQANASGKRSESDSFRQEGHSLRKKADYGAKAIEAQEAGKTMLAGGYREAAAISQRAADQFKLAGQANAAGKVNESDSLEWEGRSLQEKADYGAKSYEAEEAGKTQLAVGYLEAAETSQRAADQFKLSVKRKATEEMAESRGVHEVSPRDYAGRSLQKRAEYQAKASEAQEARRTTIVAGYLEAVGILQRALDQYELSAEREIAGKEYFKLGRAGDSLQKQADYQTKASHAQEEGRTRLVTGYREAAVISQRAADQWNQSAQACAAGNSTESTHLSQAGHSLDKLADYQAKACEAEDAGKFTRARGYQEAIAMIHRAAEQQNVAVLAKVAGRESEYTRLWEAGRTMRKEAYTIAEKADKENW